ncbi:MAG: hypothetical protein FJX76_02970 [Armatimonadetes bacterium]|nr:hypothetical protein [Armatimonadota bacterium]
MDSRMPSNFRWFSPRKVAGSARLSHPENVGWLAEQGIRGIVSAIPLWEDVRDAIKTAGIHHLELPIEDFGVPTDEQVAAYLAFVDEHLARQEPVLVHCAYGVGRTGTLAALWLVHTGMDAQDALHRVGVESNAQVRLVRRWEDRTLEQS